MHYPSALPGFTPNREIDVLHVQHPSITVCLPLIQRPFLREIYLGVSDIGCCQWCSDWFRSVSSTFRIDVYRYLCGDEYPDDWLIPQGLPATVTETMVEMVQKNVDRLFEEVGKPPLLSLRW